MEIVQISVLRGQELAININVQILPSPAITFTTQINNPLQDPPGSVRKCPCFVCVCVSCKLPVCLTLCHTDTLSVLINWEIQ